MREVDALRVTDAALSPRRERVEADEEVMMLPGVILDAILVVLLALTLVHARRLERALGVLQRDRAVLESLVHGFNESTRAAEAGVEQLRAASEDAGRRLARQAEMAERLRDDLSFLADRGDRIAERLEYGVREARSRLAQAAPPVAAPVPAAPAPVEAAPPPVAGDGPAIPARPGRRAAPARLSLVQLAQPRPMMRPAAGAAGDGLAAEDEDRPAEPGAAARTGVPRGRHSPGLGEQALLRALRAGRSA